MKKRTVYREEVETVVDEDGNQQSQTTRTSYAVGAEPPFVKMYINDLAALHRLRGKAGDVLLELVRRGDQDNIVTLSPFKREKICEAVGINNPKGSELANLIREIVEADVMQRISNNDFLLNPKYFARRKWGELREVEAHYLSLTIKYNADGTKETESDIHFKGEHE